MDLCFFYCTLSSILTFLPDCYSSSGTPFRMRLPRLITENRYDLWEDYQDQKLTMQRIKKKEVVRDRGSFFFCFYFTIRRDFLGANWVYYFIGKEKRGLVMKGLVII